MKKETMERFVKLSITFTEEYGEELERYPIDESQVISNAGDAVKYSIDGQLVEIITWGQNAEEHFDGQKEINFIKE